MTENITEQNNVEMTAGEMLKNARTTGRRKREIQTVAKQLCIREEFLEALEKGDYTFIPEVVYILGFARNYAMELGLDPDEIVAKIKREMGLVPDCASASDDDAKSEGGCVVADSAKGAGFFIRVKRYIVRNWKWFAAAVVALALIVVGIVIIFTHRDSVEVAQMPDVVASAPVVAAEPEYNAPVRERFGTENREKADVILQAIGESWVKIEDGRGNTVFSRVLVPGDVYYVPVGDKYKGTFGNAGGVDVWVNGKLAPKVGADHTRKTGFSMAPGSLMGDAGAAE